MYICKLGGRRKRIVKVIKKRLQPRKVNPKNKPEETPKGEAFDAYAVQSAAVDAHKLETLDKPAAEMEIPVPPMPVEADIPKNAHEQEPTEAEAPPKLPTDVKEELMDTQPEQVALSHVDKIIQVCMKMGYSFAETQDAIQDTSSELTIDKVLEEINANRIAKSNASSCVADKSLEDESKTSDAGTDFDNYGWGDTWNCWDWSWWDNRYWWDNSWKWNWDDSKWERNDLSAWSRKDSNASMDTAALNSPTEQQVDATLRRLSSEHLDGKEDPNEEPSSFIDILISHAIYLCMILLIYDISEAVKLYAIDTSPM